MILVAGGTGRLGRQLVPALIGSGERVRILTREPERAAAARALGAEIVVGDIRDAASVRTAVAGATAVISAVHGFAGPGDGSPASVDRDGNAILVDLAAAVGADVVLMSAVGAAADSPLELFRMKYAAEQQLAASGVPATVIRATAFAELWIELLRETARGGRPLVFGRGHNQINFVSVRDVAALVVRVVTDAESRGRTLSIGGPANLTFDELARLVQAADGRSATPRHVPRPILRIAAQTVGRIKPAVGRQVRAAIAMDTGPFTFGGGDARERYPDLPGTSIEMLLHASRLGG